MPAKNVEEVEKILFQKQVQAAQTMLDGILAPNGLFSVRQLKDMLNSATWEPLLDHLKLNVAPAASEEVDAEWQRKWDEAAEQAKANAAAAQEIQAEAPAAEVKAEAPAEEEKPAPKRRGRPPGKKSEPKQVVAKATKKAKKKATKKTVAPKSVSLEGIPEKNQAQIVQGTKRALTMWTPEQRADQRKVIYQAVAKKQNSITTPLIIQAVVSKYPQINESVVRSIVKDLLTEKHLKMVRLKDASSRVIHYALGATPL